MKLRFLGTGTSQGVPMIGCDCAVCRSPDSRNRRFRTSALIEADGFTILIDATPDLRSQALAGGLKRIDAVLFTHSHSDHLLGIDDLRRFNWLQKQRLPAYAPAETRERIATLFPYALLPDREPMHPYTRLDLRPVEQPFQLGPFQIRAYPLPHGSLSTYGYVFESDGRRRLAYYTDCKDVTPEARKAAAGVPVFVLDALRFEPHPTHLSVSESLRIVKELAPAKSYFIHLTHDVDHARHGAELPAGVEFAYDGLEVPLSA